MEHGQEVQQQAEPSSKRRPLGSPLGSALAITITVLVAEVVGGLYKGSLALLADAGHIAPDVAALALALFAGRLARCPATPERSFGYHRTTGLLSRLPRGPERLSHAGPGSRAPHSPSPRSTPSLTRR